MNALLWSVQVLLGLAMLSAGGAKLALPKPRLAARMGGWVEDFSPLALRLIGACEVLGAVGVVAPLATGILPVLTPVAAAGLVLLLLGAAYTHVRRRERTLVVPPLVLVALAAFVAIGRR